MVERRLHDEPMWDQPEVHEVYRRWHRVLDEYDGDRMAVAEAWTQTPESMARFVRPDELSQTFNFGWLLAEWSATAFADVITGTLTALAPVGAAPTWVLSNHDVVRHPTRYGGGERGLARARAATLTMLALPGSAYVYQGEELGLPEVAVAPEHWQDPASLRTGEKGRDGCRVPLPWSGTAAPYGFGPGEGQPWIPQPPEWAGLSVEAQEGREGSTLEFYRDALRARREHALGAGLDVRIIDGPREVLADRAWTAHRGPELRHDAGRPARGRRAGRQRGARRRQAPCRHRRLAPHRLTAGSPPVLRSSSSPISDRRTGTTANWSGKCGRPAGVALTSRRHRSGGRGSGSPAGRVAARDSSAADRAVAARSYYWLLAGSHLTRPKRIHSSDHLLSRVGPR